jgi:pilus assembly protein FimV
MAGSSAPAQFPSASVESQIPSDGDPLAEADVYLSYGRDLQAEEILEEALRATPNRLPIITKLLEVYARRFDWDAFEPLARRARTLTGAQGPDWARVVALGASLAPVGHPLFGADASDEDLDARDLAAAFGAASPAASTRDFVREASPGSAAIASPPATPAGLDLDIDGFRMPAPTPDAPASVATAQATELDSLFEDDLGPASGAYRASPTPPGAPMEFDLAGLSLDLNPPAAATAASAGAGTDADALATKLSLAQEFLSIGDTEGARSLAEEVRAQASGDLRARAERLLSELG